MLPVVNMPVDILSIIRNGDGSILPDRLKLLFGTDIRKSELLDVSTFFPFANPSRCVIDFRNVIPEVRDTVQVFARMEIYFGLSVSTVQHHIRDISNIFAKALDLGVWDFRMLELRDLKRILNDGNHSAGYCFRACLSLKNMYQMLGSFFGQTGIQMDMKGLESLIGHYSYLERATMNANKTPDIDPEYYDYLESVIPMLAMDESLPINYRMTAALLWLEMYTGLRPSELFTLKTSSRHVTETSTGKRYDYLTYGVPKLSHGGQIEKYAECFMLPGAIAAFDTLLILRKKIKGYRKSDSLFLLEGKGHLDDRRFRYYIPRLFMSRMNDLVTGKWNDVKQRIIQGKSYRIPSLMQYRVHLCSYLYRQGIGIHIIELGMSHLTEAMQAYYVRVQDKTFRSNQNRMDNLIRTRINNDFDLEDHTEKGEELLNGFLFALSRFRVYARRVVEMKAKEYDYEIDRYSKKCRNLLSTELRPGLSYLDRAIALEGKDAVLKRHPALVAVISNMASIENEFLTWEKAQ